MDSGAFGDFRYVLEHRTVVPMNGVGLSTVSPAIVENMKNSVMSVGYSMKHDRDQCTCFSITEYEDGTSTQSWNENIGESCQIKIKLPKLEPRVGVHVGDSLEWMENTSFECIANTVEVCRKIISTYGLFHCMVSNGFVTVSLSGLYNCLREQLQNGQTHAATSKIGEAVTNKKEKNPEMLVGKLKTSNRRISSQYCKKRFEKAKDEADNTFISSYLAAVKEILDIAESAKKLSSSVSSDEQIQYRWLLGKIGLQHTGRLALMYSLCKLVLSSSTPSSERGAFPSMRKMEGEKVVDRTLEERAGLVENYTQQINPHKVFFDEFGDSSHGIVRMFLMRIAMPDKTLERLAKNETVTMQDFNTNERVTQCAYRIYQILMKANHHTGRGTRSLIVPLQIDVGINLLQSSQVKLWGEFFRNVFLDSHIKTRTLAVEAIAENLKPKVIKRFCDEAGKYIEVQSRLPWIICGDNIDIGNSYAKGSHGLHLSICLNLSVKYHEDELDYLMGQESDTSEQWPLLEDAEKAMTNVGSHGERFREDIIVALYLNAVNLTEEFYQREHQTSFWKFDNQTSQVSMDDDPVEENKDWEKVMINVECSLSEKETSIGRYHSELKFGITEE